MCGQPFHHLNNEDNKKETINIDNDYQQHSETDSPRYSGPQTQQVTLVLRDVTQTDYYAYTDTTSDTIQK